MTLTEEGIAVLDGDAWLSQQVRDEKRLDVQYSRVLVEMMRVFIPRGGVVADVGACLGDHTVGYADIVGPNGRVHAFEPNPDAFECLRYNLQYRPWVECYPYALADQISRCEVGPEPNNLNNLGMVTIHRELPDGPIVMTTLDDVAKHWPRLDFMKIDVEGVEHALLDGAAQTIARFMPPILIEVNRGALANHGATPHDVFTRLKQFGYVFTPVCVAGVEMDPFVRINDDEVDVVCVLRSHPMASGFMELR